VLAKYTDDNGKELFTELIFDKAIDPHTENNISRFPNDSKMSIVNSAGLFDLEVGFGGFSYDGAPAGTKYCTKEIIENDPGMTYCMPLHLGQEDLEFRTDVDGYRGPAQQESYDVIFGTINHFYNTTDAYKAMLSWINMKKYKNVPYIESNALSYIKDLKAKNGEDYVSRNFYEAVIPNDKVRLTILYGGGSGVAGRGNGSFTPLGETKTINHGYVSIIDSRIGGKNGPEFHDRAYKHVHHELMHTKDYQHPSGMTSGWSDFVYKYIKYGGVYTMRENPEAKVPKYTFSTKQVNNNQVQLTIYKKDDAQYNDLTIEILSSAYTTGDDIIVEKRDEDGENQITVTVNNGLKTRLIIRVYGEDSWEVMSKFITID